MNILLIGISFIYIFAVIGLSTIFFRKNQGELSRKFIHIMVGNWVFISIFFTDVIAAIFVPAVFIIINALSRKYNLISSMEGRMTAGEQYIIQLVFALRSRFVFLPDGICFR